LILTEHLSIIVFQSGFSPAVALPFSPVKLVLLIGWVYLCLYCVHLVQFSPLIPEYRRPLANIITIFTGPILLIVLITINTIKKSSQKQGSIFEILKQYLPGKSTVTLCDLAGNALSDIHGQTKYQQHDRRLFSLTEQMITDALAYRADDIFIEPMDKSIYTVGFQIDGVVTEADQIETDDCVSIINNIKVLSGMDIAEKTRHQNGTFTAKNAHATITCRAVINPTTNGEKLSIRILKKNADLFNLNNIGLSKKQQITIKNAVAKPTGIILICGPADSGKTITMYAMLHCIDFFIRSVVTIEDPIECLIPNVNQIEVNPNAGVTFANSLHATLKKAPEVVCIGDIRDKETASLAIQAAQKNQLIIAAMHCESTASTMVKLLDLGIEPQQLASTLNLIISQRLIRKLCNNCKELTELTKSQTQEFRKKKVNYRNIFRPVGCEQCNDTGYYGRTAIYDILVVDDKLKTGIAQNKLPFDQLRKEGNQRGKSNLQKQGLKKVVSGITSIEELDRVIG